MQVSSGTKTKGNGPRNFGPRSNDEDDTRVGAILCRTFILDRFNNYQSLYTAGLQWDQDWNTSMHLLFVISINVESTYFRSTALFSGTVRDSCLKELWFKSHGCEFYLKTDLYTACRSSKHFPQDKTTLTQPLLMHGIRVLCKFEENIKTVRQGPQKHVSSKGLYVKLVFIEKFSNYKYWEMTLICSKCGHKAQSATQLYQEYFRESQYLSLKTIQNANRLKNAKTIGDRPRSSPIDILAGILLSKLPHHANLRTLSHDSFNDHQPLYTTGFQRHQDSTRDTLATSS
ncbi:hypothetical protein TNCV_1220641 [Trichonephila clavipes]|nr:hypothetical protein TNCV_1220641 [Trichonephila clavipes]